MPLTCIFQCQVMFVRRSFPDLRRLCLSSSICASGPPELAAPTLALPVPIDLKVED
eukprot:COSAG06_NODE_32400_length_506_cov_9.820639_1_plen_55_part_10